MIIFYLVGFLLICVGGILLLGLTPESVTDDLMHVISPEQTMRDQVLLAQGKKKSRKLTREILHIKEALDTTGKGTQFTIACALSILLLVVGSIAAILRFYAVGDFLDTDSHFLGKSPFFGIVCSECFL